MFLKNIFVLLLLVSTANLSSHEGDRSCRIRLSAPLRIEDFLFSHPEHIGTQISSNLRMLSTQGSRTGYHEVSAATKMAQHMPQRNFLLAAEMRGFKSGIPIFDGVIYDSAGNPESNFSLKSIMLDEMTGDNLRESFKSASDFARSKLKSFYWNNWMERKGFSYSNERYKLKGSNVFNHHSNEYINNFADLFGIKEGDYRPSSIAVDFYSSRQEKADSVNFEILSEVDPQGQPNQVLEIKIEGLTPRKLSLSSLQLQLKQHAHLRSYFILGAKEVIEVRPDEVIVHSQPAP